MDSKATKAGIRVVPDPSRTRLSGRQLTDYRAHRKRLLKWALAKGKDPDKKDGYARDTVSGRAYRLDRFYRWVWEQEDHYTTAITHEHADGWLRERASGDTSQADKAAHLKSLKMLFRWRATVFGDEEWEPEMTFSTTTGSTNPKDFLTRDEREAVRDAALEYGSVPNYDGLSPSERDRWKAYLAQRFETPKREIGPKTFERANSWKVPSLLWTALDTGLRPVEVKRATTDWVDPTSKVLRIPREDSSKNDDNWVVSISERTASALMRWLTERDHYDKYAGTNALWLNRVGNPYQYYSLNRIFRQVCDEAGIPADGRTFYAIRHSVGTYMAREEDLAAAQAQLRHRSPQTTMRYDQAPPEDRLPVRLRSRRGEGVMACSPVPDRLIRAVLEDMTVRTDAPDLYTVVSESGQTYRVDPGEPVCICPDHQYRNVTCKHIRRVEPETGARDSEELQSLFLNAAETMEIQAAQLESEAASLRDQADHLRRAQECASAITDS